MNKAFIISLIVFIITNCTSFAQRDTKGSSPKNTWRNEIEEGYILDGGDSNRYYTQLKFGDWYFRSVFFLPRMMNVKEKREDPPKSRVGALINNFGYVLRDFTSYSEGIKTMGADPGKNSFSLWFSQTDSIHEYYLQEFDYTMSENYFQPRKSYQRQYYWKKVAGFIGISNGESIPFSIIVNPTGSLTDPNTYIHSGSDSILLKTLYGSNKREKIIRNNIYKGFEFYKHGQLVGGATRRGNSEESKYKYWINTQLDFKTKQILAGMIFIIVGFIR